MPAIQKKLEFDVWNKEEGSVGDGSSGKQSSQECSWDFPLMHFLLTTTAFHKSSSTQAHGGEPRGDFEHLLIVDEVIGW